MKYESPLSVKILWISPINCLSQHGQRIWYIIRIKNDWNCFPCLNKSQREAEFLKRNIMMVFGRKMFLDFIQTLPVVELHEFTKINPFLYILLTKDYIFQDYILERCRGLRDVKGCQITKFTYWRINFKSLPVGVKDIHCCGNEVMRTRSFFFLVFLWGESQLEQKKCCIV